MQVTSLPTAARQRRFDCPALDSPAPPSGFIKVDLRQSAPIDLGSQSTDEWQVAVPLVIVQAVADDEFRRNVEADVLDVHLHLGGVGLAQKSSDLH